MNLLKNFMSAKYEQKRFYVDPSKLPKGELSEIQSQTARALSSASNLSNTMQKSPSLSSTRSCSSQQSSPSPILNNFRGQTNNSQQSSVQPNRLVSSVTLPDIKPLTSLMGPSVPNITSNPNQNVGSDISKTLNTSSSGLNSVNFNNFTMGSAQVNSNNGMLNASPWASESNGDHRDGNFGNSDTNFADFEDAFSSNKMNGVSDLFASQNSVQNSNNVNISGGSGIGFANPGPGSSMPAPLLPFQNSGGSFVQNSSAPAPQQNIAANNGSEDKYAALKDLDSLFKQTASKSPFMSPVYYC